MRLFFSLCFISLLSACGGGGGGGGGGSTSPVYKTTNYSGTSVSVAYTNYYTIGTPTSPAQGATYSETVDSSNVIQSNTMTAANGNSVSFNRANGDTIVTVSSSVIGFQKADGSASALTGYATGLGWSYQSFGVWQSGLSSGNVNAASVGSVITPGASIPTSGFATYNGVSGGIYGGTLGTAAGAYFVTSNMSATANFASRSISFATTNSVFSSTLTGPYTGGSGLNLTGTLTYAAGTNSFSGTVNSAGAGLTGTAGGQFYGPSAQEIGGVFALKNGGLGYIGGFGGKR